MHSEVRRRSRRWSESARAFKRLVFNHCNATGDQESDVAAVLNIAPSYLSNLMNGQRAVPVDLLIHATRALGESTAIEAVCRMCGGTFQRDPDVEHIVGDLITAINKCMGAAETASGAMADGRITWDKSHAVDDRVDEAVAALLALKADYRAKARSDGRVASLAEAQARAGK